MCPQNAQIKRSYSNEVNPGKCRWAVDCAAALRVIPERGRAEAHADAPAESEHFAGRGKNFPPVRDAKAGAHVYARYSGATRTDHGPQRSPAGAKPAQLQPGDN